jgi:hypothetical protein
MTIENIDSEHIFREKDKILVFDDLIFRDIDDYFAEYDNSIIIK